MKTIDQEQNNFGGEVEFVLDFTKILIEKDGLIPILFIIGLRVLLSLEPGNTESGDETSNRFGLAAIDLNRSRVGNNIC